MGREVLVFRETSSTNDVARQAGIGGADEGIVFFGQQQTAGRGNARPPMDLSTKRGSLVLHLAAITITGRTTAAPHSNGRDRGCRDHRALERKACHH